MSKERFSRIEYLRDKLTQMGHPPANRIVWENELEMLLKQQKPVKIKPVKSKGSTKPQKIPHIAWNRKLLKGFKSNESGWLPPGYYRDDTKYVIPPYLQPAWKKFLGGDGVYGRYWKHLGLHWGSKKSRRRIKSDLDVRAEYLQDVDEFFSLAPCVPFHECKDRFPKEFFNGDCLKNPGPKWARWLRQN